MAKRRNEENKRVKAILEMLKYKGIFAWRQNNMPVATRDGYRAFIGMPGLPDIIGVLPGGRFLGIEVKSDTGKQSDKQLDFQRALEIHGGVYILAYSVHDVETKLSKLGGIK